MPGPDAPEGRDPRPRGSLARIFRVGICIALAAACVLIGLRLAMAAIIGLVTYALLYAMARVKDADFQANTEAWLDSLTGGNPRAPDDAPPRDRDDRNSN